MARPRKPTILLETSGAFDKNPNRKREGEPVPPDGEPIKPKYLKGKALQVWKLYAPICFGMGTLKRGDEAEFATWCDMQAEYEKDPSRFQTSRVAQKRAYAEKFGIAGAGSRAKLGVTDGGKNQVDPAAKYLTGAGRPGNTLCN
jgi:phage terminase small subunit